MMIKARENIGSVAMRAICIETGQHMSDTWFALPEDDRDCMAFDWEYAPAYALRVMDWNGAAERGDYCLVPSVQDAAAIMLPVLQDHVPSTLKREEES
jgi:hypothetical protein